MRLRTVLTILGILFSVEVSRAQLVRGFGIKVGSVSSTENWDGANFSDHEFMYRWGSTASAFLELVDIPPFSLITEAQYAQRGVKIIVHVTAMDVDPRIIVFQPRVDYFSMPVMAKLRFPVSNIELYFIAGPRFDLLMSKHQTAFFDSWGINFVDSEAGAIVGLGAESGPLLPVHVLVEVRYNRGLTHSLTSKQVQITSHSFDFMVGVIL
jgi:hypothetical protein